MYHEVINGKRLNLGVPGVFRALLISGAANHGQSWILRESMVATRELTEKEKGPAIGFHSASMHAIRAKTRALPYCLGIGLIRHAARITHSLAGGKNPRAR